MDLHYYSGHKIFNYFVTLSEAKGLDSSAPPGPQNDRQGNNLMVRIITNYILGEFFPAKVRPYETSGYGGPS
jgi:hypothetical protein